MIYGVPWWVYYIGGFMVACVINTCVWYFDPDSEFSPREGTGDPPASIAVALLSLAWPIQMPILFLMVIESRLEKSRKARFERIRCEKEIRAKPIEAIKAELDALMNEETKP